VVLAERDELTSGTTWHSAAQVTNFGMTRTMTGPGWFVDMSKAFIGKEALESRRAEGPRKCLVTLPLASRDGPAHGGASVLSVGLVVGTVTFGDCGHRVGLNLAYAFVDPGLAGPGTKLVVEVIGRDIKAEVIARSPHVAATARVRG